MLSKKDQELVKMIISRWEKFVSARIRKEFDKATGENWLTMNDRERYLSELIRIFKLYKRNEIVYD